MGGGAQKHTGGTKKVSGLSEGQTHKGSYRGGAQINLKYVARLSYNAARLHLMAQINFWQNSTPFFDATAFSATKIGEFRKHTK